MTLNNQQTLLSNLSSNKNIKSTLKIQIDMENKTQKFKIRLGLFVAGGLALFVMGIFIIGKQQNLFNPIFKITTSFYNVSGLQVGNNIRFGGINVGIVDDIKIINDSTVSVDMFIKKEIRQFIRSDCKVALGSEGLIGDRILIVSQGSNNAPLVKNGQYLASIEPVETDAILASVQITAYNAEIITNQLAEIMLNINNGEGTIGRLIRDSTFADNLSKTMLNLRKSSKGLNENMEAAKDNFLLKGYYRRKEKAAEDKK